MTKKYIHYHQPYDEQYGEQETIFFPVDDCILKLHLHDLSIYSKENHDIDQPCSTLICMIHFQKSLSESQKVLLEQVITHFLLGDNNVFPFDDMMKRIYLSKVKDDN